MTCGLAAIGKVYEEALIIAYGEGRNGKSTFWNTVSKVLGTYAAERGYGAKWQRERRKFLESNPFCVKCYEEGHITMATVVDHIVPHRGDQKLFWDRSNWQPLCEHHHNVKTMTEDRFKEYRF